MTTERSTGRANALAVLSHRANPYGIRGSQGVILPFVPPASSEFTVVIPTRDRAGPLRRALSHALSQRGVEIEVIVVDDASRDETLRSRSAVHDDRVRWIRNAIPLGVSASRNRGIDVASGRWIAFLDDDDLWAPDKLSTQRVALEAEGAGFAYASVLCVDERLRPLKVLRPPPRDQLDRRLLRYNAMPAGGSNVVVDRALLESVGGFDPTLDHLADWDLWIRLAARAPAAVCHEILVAYVEHAGAMHATAPAELGAEFRRLTHKHAREAAARGVTADERRFLHFVASGHRRGGRRREALGLYLQAFRAYHHVGDLARALSLSVSEDAFARLRRAMRASDRGVPPWLERQT